MNGRLSNPPILTSVKKEADLKSSKKLFKRDEYGERQRKLARDRAAQGLNYQKSKEEASNPMAYLQGNKTPSSGSNPFSWKMSFKIKVQNISRGWLCCIVKNKPILAFQR